MRSTECRFGLFGLITSTSTSCYVYGASDSALMLTMCALQMFILLLFFCVKTKQMLNNGCNDFLFGVHCVEEGDRILPLQSYGLDRR